MSSRYCMVCHICQASDAELSYHSIPNSENIKIKWLKACNIKEYNRSIRICSQHFTKTDFSNLELPEVKRKRLKRDAIPSISLDPKPPINAKSKQNRRHYSCCICLINENRESYYSFPNDPAMRKKWTEACGITYLNSYSKICGQHFQETDFSVPIFGKKRYLNKNAVPSKFLSPLDSPESEDTVMNSFIPAIEQGDYNISSAGILNSTCTDSAETEDKAMNSFIPTKEQGDCNVSPVHILNSSCTDTMSTDCETRNFMHVFDDRSSTDFAFTASTTMDHSINGTSMLPSTSTSTPISHKTSLQNRKLLWRYSADIGTPHVSTPRKAKTAITIMKREILKLKKENLILKQYKRRAIVRIRNFTSLVKHLQKKLLISDGLKDHLMVC